jgi:hypothetical protein
MEVLLEEEGAQRWGRRSSGANPTTAKFTATAPSLQKYRAFFIGSRRKNIFF